MKQLLIYTCLLLACQVAWGQRFDAHVFAGANMCQVDGDDAGHYNHLGLRAGVGTSMILGERGSNWRLAVELAYTQKGSQMGDGQGKIALQYVEMPVMLTYEALDGRLRLGAGLAPAVKVGTSVTWNGIADESQEARYRTFDWLPVTLAAQYMLTGHLGIDIRWQTSMVSIYDGAGPYRLLPSNHGAFNRLISVGLVIR